mmetsp:Transcript_19016/g.34362  ORF Transcript_19016/g.34362 Transcript_19016/m.34362 type:complete len:358 (-) Transcript_19016:43-1116(-)
MESKRPVPPLESGEPLSSLEPGQKRLLCYGDSLTAGFCMGGARFEPYGKTLGSALTKAGVPSEVWSCGLCAFTALDMVAEINSEQTRPDAAMQVGQGLARLLDTTDPLPDLVLIMAGTNDLRKGADVQTTCRAVRELHAACHARGVPTIALAAPLPQRAKQQKFSKLLSNWCKTQPWVMGFFDPEEMMPRSRRGRFWEPDTLHFTAVGSKHLGSKLAAALASVLLGPVPREIQASVQVQPPAERRSKTCTPVSKTRQTVPILSFSGDPFLEAMLSPSHRLSLPAEILAFETKVVSPTNAQIAMSPPVTPLHNQRISVPQFRKAPPPQVCIARPSSCFAFERTAVAVKPQQRLALVVR